MEGIIYWAFLLLRELDDSMYIYFVMMPRMIKELNIIFNCGSKYLFLVIASGCDSKKMQRIRDTIRDLYRIVGQCKQ